MLVPSFSSTPNDSTTPPFDPNPQFAQCIPFLQHSFLLPFGRTSPGSVQNSLLRSACKRSNEMKKKSYLVHSKLECFLGLFRIADTGQMFFTSFSSKEDPKDFTYMDTSIHVNSVGSPTLSDLHTTNHGLFFFFFLFLFLFYFRKTTISLDRQTPGLLSRLLHSRTPIPFIPLKAYPSANLSRDSLPQHLYTSPVLLCSRTTLRGITRCATGLRRTTAALMRSVAGIWMRTTWRYRTWTGTDFIFMVGVRCCFSGMDYTVSAYSKILSVTAIVLVWAQGAWIKLDCTVERE